jgi:hypothetical protein
MESALIRAPPKVLARRSAKADLPLAVGPAMRIAETLVNRLVALNQSAFGFDVENAELILV